MTTVVGAPLQLPRIAKPTPADVAEWHGKYVKALEATFEKHRATYAKEGAAAKLQVL